MTESRARRDLDFDSLLDDPDGDDGWYGQAQAADATFVHEVGELERDDSQEDWQDDPDTDRWYVPEQAAELAPAAEADDVRRVDAYDEVWDEPRERRWDGPTASRNGRNGTPRIGEWTFTVSRPQPWYDNKRLKTGLIAAAAVAITVPLVLLVARSFAAGDEESTTVPSKVPTSAEPAPTSAAPALSTARQSPPAPPPPPPPPPAETGPQPVVPRQYYPQPRQGAPQQSDKPEIGVTRTPVTRAPISAEPPAPPPSERNSGTPGDEPAPDRPRRGFGPF